VHTRQVQENIASALNIAKEFNNTDLTTYLATAQLQMSLANNTTGTARAQALQAAENAMSNARSELSSMGYSGRSKSSFGMSKPNTNKLLF